MSVNIIGFSGRAGSGKTTAAEHLALTHSFKRVSFADPLREMLYGLGVSYDVMRGPGKELPHADLLGQTPRHALQTLGTEWGRKCMGEDFWVGIAEREIHFHRRLGNRVVIDDVRFPNEVKMIREMGGMVIHIIGGKSEPLQAGAHESETQELGRDWLIRNDLNSNLMPGLLDAIIWNESLTPAEAEKLVLERDAL